MISRMVSSDKCIIASDMEFNTTANSSYRWNNIWLSWTGEKVLVMILIWAVTQSVPILFWICTLFNILSTRILKWPDGFNDVVISASGKQHATTVTSWHVFPAGSCYQVSPEVGLFRVEGEAVILAFPMFKRVLEVRNIAPPTLNYLITKSNGTEAVIYEEEGRVQQRDKQLWFLPAQASDSGEYVCTYRCVCILIHSSHS